MCRGHRGHCQSDVLVGKSSLHPQHEAFFLDFKEYFWHESLEGEVCQRANLKNQRGKRVMTTCDKNGSVFTDTAFTKRSQIHVVISFTQLCV